MNAPTPMRRPRGRPASKKDKNGRPMPVRADRDRPMQWFFEDVPRQDLYDAMLLSGDGRFRRLHAALNDDAYRNVAPGTVCRKFGISWMDLIDLWFRNQLYWGLIGLANHMPRLADDLIEDSMSHDEA